MIARDDQVLDVVLVARLHPDDTAAATMLCAVGRERHALGVVAARERDDDVLVRDQLLVRELPGYVVLDLGAAVVAVVLGQLVEVGLDEGEDLPRVREDGLELGDEP